MGGDFVQPTMSVTKLFGCDAVCADLAGRGSRSCRDWLAQSAHYTLRCRQQACERISAGDSLEQAAPHCQDPARLPDPSTVRRWVQRRLFSVCWWVKTGATSEHVLRAPTILAWDLAALSRNLPLEARSP
jgi:hypothetical protein